MSDSSPPLFRSLFLAIAGTVLALATLVAAFFLLQPSAPGRRDPAVTEGFLTENTIAIVELQNAKDAWKKLERLSDADQLLVESVLRSQGEEWFGPTVSLTEDLLPLLSSPALLYLERGSGATLFAIIGQADRELVDATLDRLHVSMRATLSTPEKVVQLLDDTFTSVTMRSSSIVEEENATKGSWQLRTTFHPERGGLASAVAGNRFAITNDRILLEEMVAAGPRVTIPRGITAEGMVRMGLLREMLELEGWSAAFTLPLPWNQTGSLLWSFP